MAKEIGKNIKTRNDSLGKNRSNQILPPIQCLIFIILKFSVYYFFLLIWKALELDFWWKSGTKSFLSNNFWSRVNGKLPRETNKQAEGKRE